MLRRIRSSAPFLLGFTLASIAGMLLRASPAMAQQSWQDLSIARPPAPALDKPRRQPPKIAAPVDEAATTTQPRSTPAAAIEAPRPGDPVIGATAAALRQQPPDTEIGTEPTPLIDGHMETSEPAPPDDGNEPALADPRLPADKAAFLTPPAGYDELAFQIELDPLTDGRPRRLTALDPFEPVGRRAGSWVIFPTIETGSTATTNVYHSASPKPDLIFDVRPTLLAVTDWQQHALQLKATGLASAYNSFATENERSYALEVRGRLDFTRRANIEMLVSHSLDDEPRSSMFAATDGKTPTPYATDKLAVAFNQRFNRLALQLRGGITDTDYHPVATTDGGILSNDERDLSQRDVAARVAWTFNPTLTAFAEAAVNSQAYRALAADGISRDSSGDRFKAGLSFGNTAQIWRGEIAAGYGHQHARDNRLQDVQGMLVDANLGWRPTALTSLLFNAHTDFLTSTTVGQGNATQYQGGVELRHAFRRELVGIAALNRQVTSYQGIALTERTTTGDLGFEYSLSRSTALLGRYRREIVDGAAADGITTTDSVRLGMRYRP